MRICALLLPLLGGCIAGPSNDGPTDGVVPGDDTGTVPTGPTGFIEIALPGSDVNATVMVGETPIDPDTKTGEGTYTVVHPVGECDVWIQSATFTYLEQFPIVSEGKTEHVAWTEFGDYGVLIDHLTYNRSDGGTAEVYVEVRDEAVRIWGLVVAGLPLLGYQFEGEVVGHEGWVVSGQVIEDLSSIHYELWIDGELDGSIEYILAQ